MLQSGNVSSVPLLLVASVPLLRPVASKSAGNFGEETFRPSPAFPPGFLGFRPRVSREDLTNC